MTSAYKTPVFCVCVYVPLKPAKYFPLFKLNLGVNSFCVTNLYTTIFTQLCQISRNSEIIFCGLGIFQYATCTPNFKRPLLIKVVTNKA